MNDRIEKFLEQVKVNKNIERLAKQAGCTIDRLGYGEGNLEKFAELIINECLSVVGPTTEDKDIWMEWPMGTAKLVQTRIKQYFGVQ